MAFQIVLGVLTFTCLSSWSWERFVSQLLHRLFASPGSLLSVIEGNCVSQSIGRPIYGKIFQVTQRKLWSEFCIHLRHLPYDLPFLFIDLSYRLLFNIWESSMAPTSGHVEFPAMFRYSFSVPVGPDIDLWVQSSNPPSKPPAQASFRKQSSRPSRRSLSAKLFDATSFRLSEGFTSKKSLWAPPVSYPKSEPIGPNPVSLEKFIGFSPVSYSKFQTFVPNPVSLEIARALERASSFGLKCLPVLNIPDIAPRPSKTIIFLRRYLFDCLMDI